MAATTSKAGYRSGRDLPTVAENIELLTGQRGNKLDKAITYRELADIGLITLRKAANNALSPSVTPGVLPDETIDRPVAPTGVVANGAFHTILVEWDVPAYKGHAHAEVWRAEEDNRAKAVMVGTSAANLYSDAIGKGASVYYWVRFVNKANIQGPFHGIAGVHAATSSDVQDILDGLQGKISASHLAQELLTPIQSISQLQGDVGGLEDALSQTNASIAALDAREAQVSSLLQHSQDQLGENYLSLTVIQEQLRQRIDTYNLNFQTFRDAVFSVNPTTGEITMDAVNAVRSELGAEISAVSQHLDSVEAIVNTCVTRAELAGDFERLTVVEQQIDGINATLKQTATKSDVTSVASTVSQVQQSLDATNNALTQKAAQTQVDAQGQRLAAAEQQISANTSATAATAERIEQVKAQLELADQTISSSITELAQSVATDKQATAQRLTAMEATIGGQSAAISELQQIVTGDGSTLASKFESLSASADIAAEAALQAALANASADIEQRNAAGAIRQEQSVMASEQEAQAKTIEQITASFGGIAAQIVEEKTARADGDAALSTRIDTVQAKADSAAAAVQSESTARASADSALSTRIDAVQATAGGLSSAVQTQSQAISDLQKGAQAMWTAKANAGGISAGIGLIAKSDGTSQVAISASQVFVFNPNSPNALSPLFAIDNGQVIMAEAIIRTATIQILNSQQITADYVKAGISLSAPAINGGSIVIGSNFTVTASGAMTAWSATLRYVTSYYGTFNYATISNATINQATINNCTITETCDVKGTIYAEKIVGDVVNPYLFDLDLSQLASGYAELSVNLLIQADSRERKLTLMQSLIQLDYDLGSSQFESYVKLDGSTIASCVGTSTVGVNQFLIPARIITLPAGKAFTVTASIYVSRAAINRGSPKTYNPAFVVFVSR